MKLVVFIVLLCLLLAAGVNAMFWHRPWRVFVPFILPFLFVLFGISASVLWYVFRPSLNYYIILIGNLAPGAFLLFLFLARYKFPSIPPMFILAEAVAVFMGIAVLVSVNVLATRDYYLVVDRNMTNLEIYLEQDEVMWPQYLAYFPRKISIDCQKASFFRGRLYDLAVLQLRCKMPPAEVKNILDTYIPNSKYIEDGYNSAAVNKKAYWIHKFRNNSNNGFAPLPADFKVMVLYVDPKADEPTWQIYYNCGIAVSTKTNEVVYWATYPG